MDHLAVVSDDPEALFAAYEALGFLLTPVTRHSGSPTPGAPVTPWGIGNRCAMFANGGYLELLAVFDRSLPCRGFDERLQRYAGLHIVAFGCADAELAADTIRAGGIDVVGVGRLERKVTTETGDGLAAFSLVRFADVDQFGCHFNVMQHHTPGLLWQRRYLDHPNGARSLKSVTLCVADPEKAAARYAIALDSTVEADGTIRTLKLKRGQVIFVRPDSLSKLYDNLTPPTVPFVAAMTIAVTSLDITRKVLNDHHLPYAENADGILVGTGPAQGSMLQFTEMND